MRYITYVSSSLLLLPIAAFADSVTTPTTFGGLMGFLVSIIDSLIVLIFGITFLVFIWKLIDAWIINADNDSKRSEGKTVAITAIVVMVIMVSLWAILKLLQQGFGY
jgi:hypothetical protein